MSETITVTEALKLMRSVSRVTRQRFLRRDGLGRWKHCPEITRYQEAPGEGGMRGTGVAVVRADVEAWVEARRRQAEERRAEPAPPVERGVPNYESLRPFLAARGAFKTMQKLGLDSTRCPEGAGGK
jgi:hypothetical protein